MLGGIGIANTPSEEAVSAAAKQVELDNEIRDYLEDLRKLSRDHLSDCDVAARSIKALETSKPTDFHAVRSQRILDLRHYVRAYASDYAYSRYVELTGEKP